MTFDEARKKQLERLRLAQDGLFKIVSDPNWNNTMYNPYKEARKEVDYAIDAVRRVNEAAIDAED